MSELEHKIRLLTLASLAFEHVGHNLSYAKIAQTLQVDVNEVEKWAIDGTFLAGAGEPIYQIHLFVCSHPCRTCLWKVVTNNTEFVYYPRNVTQF